MHKDMQKCKLHLAEKPIQHVQLHSIAAIFALSVESQDVDLKESFDESIHPIFVRMGPLHNFKYIGITIPK